VFLSPKHHQSPPELKKTKQKRILERKLKEQKDRDKKVKEKENTKLLQSLNSFLEKGKKMKDQPPPFHQQPHFIPFPTILPT